MKMILMTIAASMTVMLSAQAAVIDFDDKVLAPDSAFNANATVSWNSGGADFLYGYNYGCCWSSFTYSNKTDTTTAGFTNDQSAITGDGVGAGQDNYAVGYLDTFSGTPLAVDFGGARTVQGSYFTNVTYTYLAIANGDDGNDPAFVKGPFGDGDFYKLIVSGLDASGLAISSLEVLLADGANVVDSWEWYDLSSLGEVYGLSFAMDSSDSGAFGLNTPTYFAMDSLTIVPVPAAVWLFATALGFLGLRHKLAA
mgnify:CR=1 FL=1|jgi:hypothetical protein